MFKYTYKTAHEHSEVFCKLMLYIRGYRYYHSQIWRRIRKSFKALLSGKVSVWNTQQGLHIIHSFIFEILDSKFTSTIHYEHKFSQLNHCFLSPILNNKPRRLIRWHIKYLRRIYISITWVTLNGHYKCLLIKILWLEGHTFPGFNQHILKTHVQDKASKEQRVY